MHGSLEDLQCTAAWRTYNARQPGGPTIHGSLEDLQCTAAWRTYNARQPGGPTMHGSCRAESRSLHLNDRKEEEEFAKRTNFPIISLFHCASHNGPSPAGKGLERIVHGFVQFHFSERLTSKENGNRLSCWRKRHLV